MGNGLSKEQEQCFRLIQQLFKAAGCLPDKGSLDLEIWEKAGQRSSHNQESLDKKSRDLWNGGMGGSRHPLDPSHGSPNCCGHHSCVWGVGRWCTLARRAVGPDLSAQDRWQQQRRGWSPLHSLLPVCMGAAFPGLRNQA